MTSVGERTVVVAGGRITTRAMLAGGLDSVKGITVTATEDIGQRAASAIERLRPETLVVIAENSSEHLEHLVATAAKLQRKPAVIIISTAGADSLSNRFFARGLKVLGAFDPQQTGLIPALKEVILKSAPASSGVGIAGQLKGIREARISAEHSRQQFNVVAVGVSTGGPAALESFLCSLPASLDVPIVIAQHMPKEFTAHLANSLNGLSPLGVKEAESGDLLLSGRVYIAPGGQQMKVVRRPRGVEVLLTDDPPEQACKPSADYLFRSIAEVYGSHSLGVILTGMGCDGMAGSELIKARGGVVIAQNEVSCTVYGMPKAVIEAGLADYVCHLDQISMTVAGMVRC